MMEPFDADMYPDRMIVYALDTVEDSENADEPADGDPLTDEPVPCAVVDPTQATPFMAGVEPEGRDVVTICAPADPGVTKAMQLVEVVTPGAPSKRLRSAAPARRPVNIAPYWTIIGEWVAG